VCELPTFKRVEYNCKEGMSRSRETSEADGSLDQVAGDRREVGGFQISFQVELDMAWK
jgi:hypothetical protein